MKPKKILFLIASLGLLSATSKPIFAEEILIAHAQVKKIVLIRFRPTGSRKVIKEKIFPNGNVNKVITNVKLCKRVRIVKAMNGTLLKRQVKRNVVCPDKSLYNQKRIFSNHKSPVIGVNHTHYPHYHSHSPSQRIAPPIQQLPREDNNSCKEGSIIGGLLGAGITLSATRGKDRWWAVPAGGTAGALIGCQIDGG